MSVRALENPETLTLCEGHGFRVGDLLLVEDTDPPATRRVSDVEGRSTITVELRLAAPASEGTLLANLGPTDDPDAPWWEGSPVRIHRRMDGSDPPVPHATIPPVEIHDGWYRYWTRNRRVWELVVDADHHVLQVLPDVFPTTEVEGVFNVLDFGAVGDGVEDDTAAIQQALDAAVAFRGAARTGRGGVAYVPTGHYLVTRPLVCKSDVTLRGEGMRVSQIRGDFEGPVVTTEHVEHNREGRYRNNHIVIEKLGFQNGVAGGGPRPGSLGIRLAQTTYGRLSEVSVQRADCGILVSGVGYYNVLERLQVAHCTHGVVVTDQSNDTWLRDSNISDCSVGVALWGGAHYGLSNTSLVSVLVQGAREVCIQVGGGSHRTVRNTTLVGSRAEGHATADGIRVEDNARGTVIVNSYLGGLACRIRDAGENTLVLRDGGHRTPLLLWEVGQVRAGRVTWERGAEDPGSFSFQDRKAEKWQEIRCARVRTSGDEIEEVRLAGAWWVDPEVVYQGNGTHGLIDATTGRWSEEEAGARRGVPQVEVVFERAQLDQDSEPAVVVSRNDDHEPHGRLTWEWQGQRTLVISFDRELLARTRYRLVYVISH